MIVAVVNADDFGLSVSINAGIRDAYENGILRSASLMANGEDFDDAASQVRELPGLGMGIHLSLVGERPIASPHKLRGLIDSDGRLPPSYADFARGFVAQIHGSRSAPGNGGANCPRFACGYPAYPLG